MLVSKQEARNLKLEYPASIYESPCLPAGRETSIDNDKRNLLLTIRVPRSAGMTCSLEINDAVYTLTLQRKGKWACFQSFTIADRIYVLWGTFDVT